MWSKETYGWEEEEGDVDANMTEEGTRGTKEGGGGISGALVVATSTLNKGAVMADSGATIGPAKAVGTSTSVAKAIS